MRSDSAKQPSSGGTTHSAQTCLTRRHDVVECARLMSVVVMPAGVLDRPPLSMANMLTHSGQPTYPLPQRAPEALLPSNRGSNRAMTTALHDLRLALTVATPWIVVTVPADRRPAGMTPGNTIGAQGELSGTDSDLDVSIHRGPPPGPRGFGRPGLSR